ncbi:MAG: hypothetical protein OQL08_09050 [Gammaproteobacteria bacterium]|nr:hypothetical protein [Gammaproteobacteria bacterium]
MQVREAELLPNTETEIGEGINKATRGMVMIDGEIRGAIIKRIPLDGVLAECYCAVVMRAWNLPVPEPLLVRDGENWIFASLEEAYPNLKQRLHWDDNHPSEVRHVLKQVAITIVCQWHDAPIAMAADELLANDDRNVGNFLWDGERHAYIDHERTLGRVPHTKNLMANYAIIAGKQDDCIRSAMANALYFTPPATESIDLPKMLSLAKQAAFAQARMSGLADRILARFPKPDDLLARI